MGGNHLAGTLRSVCQITGDVEFPLGTFGHKLKGFHPTGYHLVYTECGRLAALDGAVEQRSVNQCAFVVALHLVGCFGIVTDVLEGCAMLSRQMGFSLSPRSGAEPWQETPFTSTRISMRPR